MGDHADDALHQAIDTWGEDADPEYPPYTYYTTPRRTRTMATKSGSAKGDVIHLTDDDYKRKKFKSAPAGTYRFKISKKSTLKKMRSGKGINIIATITKGPHKGVNVFENIAPTVGWKIAQLLTALGVKKLTITMAQLLKLLEGKELRAIVRTKKFEGKDRNEIVQWLPLKTSKDEDELGDDDADEDEDDDASDDGDDDGDNDADDDEDEDDADDDDSDDDASDDDDDEDDADDSDDDDDDDASDDDDDSDDDAADDEDEEPKKKGKATSSKKKAAPAKPAAAVKKSTKKRR